MILSVMLSVPVEINVLSTGCAQKVTKKDLKGEINMNSDLEYLKKHLEDVSGSWKGDISEEFNTADKRMRVAFYKSIDLDLRSVGNMPQNILQEVGDFLGDNKIASDRREAAIQREADRNLDLMLEAFFLDPEQFTTIEETISFIKAEYSAAQANVAFAKELLVKKEE
jgi:hypothetical protein